MTVLSIFRILAPDFNVIDDDTVNAWIMLTDPLVSKRKFKRLHDQALALLTAHRMELAGLLYAVDDAYAYGNLAVGQMRHVASYTEGKVSISFNHDQGDISTDSDSEYGLTKYGIQFMTLRDSVITTIASSAMRRW